MPAVLLKGIKEDGTNLGDTVLAFVAGLGAQTLKNYEQDLKGEQARQPNSATPAAAAGSGKQGFWANMTGPQKIGLAIAGGLLAFLIVKKL